jgi:hypothetical protein
MTGPEVDPPGALAGADRAACGSTDTGIVDEAARKLRAIWIARAALVGVELRLMADGKWLASRWCWTRELEEGQVEGWLRMVGAPV